MPREMQLEPSKTYANKKNMERAIAHFPEWLRYHTVYNEAGRCYPVFAGSEALMCGVPHQGFIVIG